MTQIQTVIQSKTLEGIREQLKRGILRCPDTHSVLIDEIDRLEDIMKVAYDFLKEDMEMCAKYMLCPIDSPEYAELMEGYNVAMGKSDYV